MRFAAQKVDLKFGSHLCDKRKQTNNDKRRQKKDVVSLLHLVTHLVLLCLFLCYLNFLRWRLCLSLKCEPGFGSNASFILTGPFIILIDAFVLEQNAVRELKVTDLVILTCPFVSVN